jgi:hypothetical protein
LKKIESLDKNNKEIIGVDMVISYKADANFIRYLVKLITYNNALMEWE